MLPLTSAAIRKMGTPIGTVITSACTTDPVSTPRRALALLKANVAAESGSHVVVRNPEGLERLPKETEQLAAGLAAGYSKARKGGKVAVHLCRCEDVSKPRGFPAGKVLLDRYRSVQASPWRPDQGT